MKKSEFLNHLVRIYAINTEDVRLGVIMDWVSQFTDEQRKRIISGIFLDFVPTATTPFPMPIHMKKHIEDLQKEAEEAYIKLNLKASSLNNVMVSDIRIYKAIQTRFGSWLEFCNRDRASEHFHRKNFIEAFIQYNDCEEIPMLMSGAYDINPLVMIGDEEQCAAYIEHNKNEFDKYKNLIESKRPTNEL